MHTDNSENYRLITWGELSDNEKLILAVLDGKGHGRRVTLSRGEIAKTAFPTENGKIAYSRVNNAMRRLCVGAWAEQHERDGTTVYQISHEGRQIRKEIESAK